MAVTGLSTSLLIRVCICPASETGRSGVMLTVAPPTSNSAPAANAPAQFQSPMVKTIVAVLSEMHFLSNIVYFLYENVL